MHLGQFVQFQLGGQLELADFRLAVLERRGQCLRFLELLLDGLGAQDDGRDGFLLSLGVGHDFVLVIEEVLGELTHVGACFAEDRSDVLRWAEVVLFVDLLAGVG